MQRWCCGTVSGAGLECISANQRRESRPKERRRKWWVEDGFPGDKGKKW